MSNFFNLMQQLEQERFGSGPIPVLPSQDEYRNDGDQKRRANDEALRLVHQLFLDQSHEPLRVVVFAGTSHRNGCSHVCAAVANTLARNTLQSVCLVEANFRSPSQFFGSTNSHGLTDAILREGSVKSFAKQVSGHNMWLLSSGAPVEDAESLIASDHLRQRMAELQEEFDFVLIDAPPLTRYSDAMVLARLSDGLVLIVDAESTRRETTEAVTTKLRAFNVPILAAVLNRHGLPVR